MRHQISALRSVPVYCGRLPTDNIRHLRCATGRVQPHVMILAIFIAITGVVFVILHLLLETMLGGIGLLSWLEARGRSLARLKVE